MFQSNAPQNYYAPQTMYPNMMQQPSLPMNAVYNSQAKPAIPQIAKPLSGRIVNSDSEITPNEVVMDGSISLFPQSDYSCIFAKQWGPDGTIQTVRYIPEVVEPETVAEATSGINLSNIMDRLDEIETLLKKQNKPYNNRKLYNNYKKNDGEKKENEDA